MISSLKKSFPALVCLFFLTLSGFGQLVSETQKHTLLQLEILQRSVLLVELPADPIAPKGLMEASERGSDGTKAFYWKEAFREKFNMCDVYFFNSKSFEEANANLTNLTFLNQNDRTVSLTDSMLISAFIFCPENSIYEPLPEKTKIIKHKKKGIQRITVPLKRRTNGYEEYYRKQEGKKWTLYKIRPTMRKVNKKLSFEYAIRHSIFQVETYPNPEENIQRTVSDFYEKLINSINELRRLRVDIKDMQ